MHTSAAPAQEWSLDASSIDDRGSKVSVTAGRAHVGELEMYYEIHAEGKPLVLLHGAIGTIDSCFRELLPALASIRQVIAVELQGHGHTADIDRPLTYEQMAEDTAALLRALGIHSADFVGYSMGGAVALQLAMSHPRLARRLGFAGGACFDSAGLYPEALDAMTKSPAGHLDGSVWHQAYVNVAPHPGAWPALVAKVNELDRTFAGWPAEEVRRVRAPTMLIIGDSDIVRPEHTVQMFRLLGGGVPGDLAGLPPSQLAVLPGTSHVGMPDQTECLRPLSAKAAAAPAPATA